MGRCMAIALLLAALPAQAQLITHRDLSYPMALTMATGALDACKARGYPVSVVVVDRGGDTMVALKGDGAGPHTMENARRKAYTARTFRMTTQQFIEDMKTRPVRREQTALCPHHFAGALQADMGFEPLDPGEAEPLGDGRALSLVSHEVEPLAVA